MAAMEVAYLDYDVEGGEKVFEDVAVDVVGVGLLTIGITTRDHARVLLYLEPRETAQLLVHVAQAMKERIDDPSDDTFHGWVTEEPSMWN